MKKFYLAVIVLFIGTATQAQVRIGSTNYASFSAAFDVINSTNTYSGQNIVMEITANFTETSPPTLGKYNYESLLIKPVDGAKTVIFSNYGLAFIGNNVTIDGENQLTLACSIANVPTLSFTGSKNTVVKRSKVLGSGSYGVISFSSHPDLGQLRNILVQQCEIGPYTTAWPTCGINVLGINSNGWLADGVVIDGNNIHDFATGTQTVPATGIEVSRAFNVDIKNNRVYQTALHPSTLTRAISVSNLSTHTNNYITANEVGSANAQGSGLYQHTGGAFVGIFYYGPNSSGTTYGTLHVSDNAIRNIALTGSFNGLGSTFSGIQSYYGSIRIINNTIGSQTTTNSITINNSGTGECNFDGITTDYNGAAVITNNTVGGMTATGGGTMEFNGIYIGATVNDGNNGLTCTGNTIGGTVAHSIQNGGATSNSRTIGIRSGNRSGGLSGNTVRNLTGFSSGTGDSGVVGIAQFSSFQINPVVSNTIFNITNANTTAGGSAVGIYAFASGSGGSVKQNFIHSLQSLSTNAAASIFGILINNAPVSMQNNMIALGNGTINDAQVTGIKYEVLASASGQGQQCKNNSIYIGGYKTAGNAPSRAFWITGLNSTYQIYNNIFVNNRSNAPASTATHYSVQVETTLAAMIANVYFGNGNGYFLAGTPTGNKASVAQLHSYLYFSGNSGFFGDPQFISPTAIIPNLHIDNNRQTIVEASGYDDVGLDIDNETRSNLTPHDIGADAGNFVAMTTAPTLNSFSNITTCTLGSLTLNGTNLSGVHDARIGNVSLQIIVATDTSITVATGTEPVSGTIKLSNAIGSAISTATITLNARPFIVVQPQSRSTCPGVATLSITANYATAYNWRRNGVPLMDNADFSGTTTATLTINNAAPNSTDQYDVFLTGSAGCLTTSLPATLTVSAYRIELVPSGPTTFCAGEYIQLTPKLQVPALQFDGVNDYIDFFGNTVQDFTMSYWVKTTQTGSTGAQWYDGNGIVDGLGGFNRNFGTSLVGSKLAFGIKVGEASQTLLSNANINTGEWVNVTVTRSLFESRVKIYINGQLDATAATTNATGFELINEGMRAGGMFNGSSYFNGGIDDIRIWKRVLDEGEIHDVNQGGNIANLLSMQLSLDENSGTQTAGTQTIQNVPLMNGVQWTNRLAPAVFTNPVWSNGSHAISLGVVASGNYSLTASYGNCPAPLTSNVVAVTVNNPSVHLATPSNSIYYCGGAALPIQAQGAITYNWSPAIGLSATTGSTVYANPAVTTNYLLQGTDANGCVGNYPFTVIVGQSSQITLNRTNAYILPGQSVLLAASGGSGNYTWSPADGLDQTSGNTVVATPTQTTVYTVRGTDCDLEQNVTVYVLPETSTTDNALDFDGFDDYVEMPVQSQGVSGTFTVSMWVKPTHPTKTMHLFSTRNGVNANTFDIQIKDGNLIHGDIGNGTDWLTTNADAPFAYQPNQWMHIAYKITPGQYKIFVNGNLIQTGNYPGTAVLYNNSSNYITLGRNNDENTLLQGTLDDLMISTFDFPDGIMTNAPRYGIPAQISYTFDQGVAGGSNPTVTLLSNQDVSGGMHGVLHNFTLDGPASNWVIGQSVQPQTITMAAQNSIVYSATYNPGATTSSGLPVTYVSSDPSIASVSGNMLLIHTVGTVTIFAQLDGNAFYENAEPKVQQLTITRKPLAFDHVAAQHKIYDRTNAALISGTLSGIVGTDVVSFTGTGTFASMNVGNAIPVTSTAVLTGADASKYTLTQAVNLSANITPKSLTVTGAVAQHKTYDGNTVAVINGATLTGIISPDVVTIASNAGTFASPNVGNSIAVTSQLTLGGAAAANYSITQPTGLSANITPVALTATISGTTSICAGQSTALQVVLSGSGLFTVTYTDGTLLYTINNYSSGTAISVAPMATATYTLVSVTGGNTQVSVSGLATITVNANMTFYADADGDGFGNAAVSQLACNQLIGYVANNTDCNDADNTKHQTFSFYVDADGDGFGAGTAVQVCAVNAATAPAGYSINNTDCDDNNASIHQTFAFYVDADGDGFGSTTTSVQCAVNAATAPAGYSINNTDCNDNNASIHQTFAFYVDVDGDGFGTGTAVPVCTANATTPPAGYTLNNTDCDDNNASIHQTFAFYVDADGDGFGTGTAVPVCTANATTPPAGYTLNNTDCDDNNASIHQTFAFYVDVDGDGFGAGTTVEVCVVNAATAPAGYSINNTDCDDNNASIHQTFAFYVDADGDGFGSSSLVSVCAANATTPPAGYSLTNTDCDDSNGAVYRSGTFYTDGDGDGYSTNVSAVVCYGALTPAGYVANMTLPDCNDSVFAINPGHAEVWYNGVDDNCDGNLDEGNQITTKLLPAFCGATLTSMGSVIGITTLAPGAAYTGWRVRVSNAAQVQILDLTVPHFQMTQLAFYAYATTYTIEVELQRNGVWLGYYGQACLLSTPAVLAEGGASAVSGAQCGQTMPKINTLISTTSLPGVTGYRFRVTNLTDQNGPYIEQILTRGLNWFTLQMLTRYNYGTTYRIEVAVKTTGDFGGYGAACEVSSPAAPSLVNCGAVATSGTQTIWAASVQGVVQYRFQITRANDGSSTTMDRGVNYFTFNQVPANIYTAGALYYVRVAVMTGNTWSPFGDVCEVNAPGDVAKGGDEAAVTALATNFKATAYPNPFTSDFGIEIISPSQEDVTLKVYDMLGKLLESKTIPAAKMGTEKVGAPYPSGVYSVVVGQGGILRTLRVIKR